MFSSCLASWCFNIMFWCNSASVVVYMEVLSAFKATRTQAGRVALLLTIQPKVVCTPHLSVPRPRIAGNDGNESLS